jgi:hypothetical protein
MEERPKAEPEKQPLQKSEALSSGHSYLFKKVANVVMKDEEVLAIAAQTDLARWWVFPPDGVVVTSHRILFLRCGFLSFNFQDFHWEHVEDVHLSTSFAGSTIMVTASSSKSGYATKAANVRNVKAISRRLVISQAQNVYSVGQQMEHTWREKIRQRIMEERQVERGQVVVQAPAVAQAAAVPSESAAPLDDPADRLRKLRGLVDEGILTQEEYDKKKAEILSAM